MSARRSRRAIGAVIAALVAGGVIGYIDTRASWDDTGVTVGLVVLTAGSLAVLSPRMRWLIGLAVGVPVWGMNVLAAGAWSAAIAAGLAILASAVGGAIGSAMRH